MRFFRVHINNPDKGMPKIITIWNGSSTIQMSYYSVTGNVTRLIKHKQACWMKHTVELELGGLVSMIEANDPTNLILAWETIKMLYDAKLERYKRVD